MPEHVTTEQIADLSARRLPPAQLLVVTRHLADCRKCRQQVAASTKPTMPTRVGQLRAALRHAAAAATHLEYEQLTAYVENTTAALDRELIVNHLESCAQCAQEARELHRLRESLTPPVALPLRQHWLERLRAYWPSPALLRPFPLGAAAVALLLFVAVVWWWRRPTPAPNLVVAPPAPASTPSAQAALSPLPAPSTTPAIVVTLQDNGRQIKLDQAGKLTGLTALPESTERTLKQILTDQKIATPPGLKALWHRPATLMSEAAARRTINLHSPVGTFVKTTQPRLRWQSLPGAQHYVVTILDENFAVVATSLPLVQPVWQVTPPLQRGKEYLWQVTTEVEGKAVTSASAEAPEAHFRILRAETARALHLLPASHLLRGTMYAQAGLLDDAEREFQALYKANPQSAVARQLLHNLRALRK